MATDTKKKTAAKKAAPAQKEAPATYTEDQVQKMVEAAVQAALKKQQQTAEIVQPKSQQGVVTLRFFSEVNDNNVVQLGQEGRFGQIVGKRWTGQIAKMDFIGSFRTPIVQALLASRELIVIDGLTEDERKLYGVDYAKGEVIEEGLYRRMTSMDEKTLVETYKALCPEWRRMVAVQFAEAYEKGQLKVTRQALLAINRQSKKDNAGYPEGDPRRKGAFARIIESMNLAEAEDE